MMCLIVWTTGLSSPCSATADNLTALTNWSLTGLLCDQLISVSAEMSGKIVRLRQAKIVRNATSRSKGRKGNDTYRVREHLTEAEMEKLLDALKRNRHGHWDWLIGLLIYRHGLRVSEACDLRWDDIDLPKRTSSPAGSRAAPIASITRSGMS
jgi:integrase